MMVEARKIARAYLRHYRDSLLEGQSEIHPEIIEKIYGLNMSLREVVQSRLLDILKNFSSEEDSDKCVGLRNAIDFYEDVFLKSNNVY